jgi:hypothetical protein
MIAAALATATLVAGADPTGLGQIQSGDARSFRCMVFATP